MIIDSDKLLIPECDETVYINQLEMGEVNENLINSIKAYLKKRHTMWWVRIAKIETLNSELKAYEKPHYCLIIKGRPKFNYARDAQALFDIMTPFLNDDTMEKFVDVSVIGYSKTFQFEYDENKCVLIEGD